MYKEKEETSSFKNLYVHFWIIRFWNKQHVCYKVLLSNVINFVYSRFVTIHTYISSNEKLIYLEFPQ